MDRNVLSEYGLLSQHASDKKFFPAANATTHDPLSDASHLILKHRLTAIIYNPSSGSGKAQRTAEAVRDELMTHGMDVILRKSSRENDPVEMDAFLKQLDFVMVAGGDGTIMGLLQPLARTGTPVFMLPSGNESLFARSFRMRSQAASVLAALQQPKLSWHYFGLVNGRSFFTMLSIGFDAEVVEYIDSYRNGPIGHAGYIVPVVHNFLEHRRPRITLIADGKKVLDGRKGYLIIANSHEYAGNLGLVPEANSGQNMLHARFFPGHDRLNVVNWLVKYALRWPINLTGSKLYQAKCFEVSTAEQDYPMQADGEFVGSNTAQVAISRDMICVLHGAG